MDECKPLAVGGERGAAPGPAVRRAARPADRPAAHRAAHPAARRPVHYDVRCDPRSNTLRSIRRNIQPGECLLYGGGQEDDYTRNTHRNIRCSPVVERCRLTVSKPVLKAPMAPAHEPII